MLFFVSLYRSFFTDHHVPPVFMLVGAGAQRHVRAGRIGQVGGKGGLGLEAGDLVVGQTGGKHLVVVGAGVSRDQIQAVGLARGIEVHIGVSGIVGGIFIAVDGRQHGAGFHVVAVDNAVVIREIRGIQAFQHDAAVDIGIAVDVVVQIEEVVRAMNDRVADHRTGAVKIAHDGAVLRLPIGEIDTDGTALTAFVLVFLDHFFRLFRRLVKHIGKGRADYVDTVCARLLQKPLLLGKTLLLRKQCRFLCFPYVLVSDPHKSGGQRRGENQHDRDPSFHSSTSPLFYEVIIGKFYRRRKGFFQKPPIFP